jgi:hypothetical protein
VLAPILEEVLRALLGVAGEAERRVGLFTGHGLQPHAYLARKPGEQRVAPRSAKPTSSGTRGTLNDGRECFGDTGERAS